MTKLGPTRHPAGPRSARREARAELLSAALKANLRRRKVQARERATADEPDHNTATPATPTEPGGSHDSAGIVDDKRSR